MKSDEKRPWHGPCLLETGMETNANCNLKRFRSPAFLSWILATCIAFALAWPADDISGLELQPLRQTVYMTTEDYVTPLLASANMVRALNAVTTNFTGFGGYDLFPARYDAGEGYRLVTAARFAGRFIELAGMKLLLGLKVIEANQTNLVYISETFWAEHYQSSPAVVGMTLMWQNVPCQIAGVIKTSAMFKPVGMFFPVTAKHQFNEIECMKILARIEPGVDAATARAELDACISIFVPCNSLARIKPALVPLPETMPWESSAESEWAEMNLGPQSPRI